MWCESKCLSLVLEGTDKCPVLLFRYENLSEYRVVFLWFCIDVSLMIMLKTDYNMVQGKTTREKGFSTEREH